MVDSLAALPMRLEGCSGYIAWWYNVSDEEIFATQAGKLLLFGTLEAVQYYADAHGRVVQLESAVLQPCDLLPPDTFQLSGEQLGLYLDYANTLEDIAVNLDLPPPTHGHIPILRRIFGFDLLHLTFQDCFRINRLLRDCNAFLMQLEPQVQRYILSPSSAPSP